MLFSIPRGGSPRGTGESPVLPIGCAVATSDFGLKASSASELKNERELLHAPSFSTRRRGAFPSVACHNRAALRGRRASVPFSDDLQTAFEAVTDEQLVFGFNVVEFLQEFGIGNLHLADYLLVPAGPGKGERAQRAATAARKFQETTCRTPPDRA